MKGKNRCRILKDIRRRIAEENNIEYITTECKYKGDCLGTCPKCEAEVRYLERELERRRSLGYKISVAGLAAGITLASAGCTPDTTSSLSSGGNSLMGDMVVSHSSHGDPSNNSDSVSRTELSSPETSDDLSVTVDGEMIDIQGDIPVSDESETMGVPVESDPFCDEPDETATAGVLIPGDFSEEELMGDIPI